MKARSRPIYQETSRQETRLRRRTLGNYRYVRMRWRVLFGCVDTIGSLLFAIVRFLTGWLPKRTTIAEPRRILLVQFDHLGDAVMTTAMFGPLRRRFPEARIDVLAAPWNRAVFDGVAEVEQVHVCCQNRFAPGPSLAWIPATLVWGLWLRRWQYDLVIDVRGEFPHNVLLWLSGARRRLGWASGGGGFLLTDKPAFVVDRPEVESRGVLLKCLDIDCDGELQPTFQPSPAAKETAEAAWSEFGSDVDSVRIVLHIGAGTTAKRWPAEHWRGLIDRLTAERNTVITLVGTSDDRQTARAVLGSVPTSQTRDWTGRFTVDELAAVLRRADVLVGADSGPAHLAAAVGTAVVTLFSGTNSIEQWQPFGARVRTLHSDISCSPCHQTTCPMAGHPCMRRILPSDVISALSESLPEQQDRELIAISPRNMKGPMS